MKKDDRIAIIGGGITALAIANILTLKGYDVSIYEKESTPGGLARSIPMNGNEVDRYYRHVFESHDQIIDMINQLGLSDKLIFKEAKMGSYSSGLLYPLNSLMDLLHFKPVSLINRIRIGMSASGLITSSDWHKFDNQSAAEYLKKRCGNEGYNIFWKPLLVNKFGNLYSDISAAWLWDRMRSRNRSRVRKSSEMLGYLSGSFQFLIQRMIDEIEKRGGKIVANTKISKIDRSDDGTLLLHRENGAIESCNACIVTIPVPQFLEIAPVMPSTYVERLSQIEYAHSICMVLNLKKSLSPYYWINIGDSSFPFAVIIEHTNLIDSLNSSDGHIVYLSRYITSQQQDIWNTPDHILLETTCRYLKRIFKDFDESWIFDYKIFRDKYTQPVFKKNYSHVIPSFSTPIDGLYLLNTSQFYPLSRCMNTSFIMASRFVQEIKTPQ